MAWAYVSLQWNGLTGVYVTADRSSRMNSEVFKAILSAHIQPNATKLIGHNFTDG